MILPGLFSAQETPAQPRPRLFLIDGGSFIFRAFYGIPLRNTTTGLPTNAIFGFVNLLFSFLKQYRPDYIAVALDADRETFRKQMFPGYKGTRKAAPAEIVPQLPYLRKVLDGLRLPWVELSGYEADDIIATLSAQMAGNGCEVVVVSSDKDLMQLVARDIKLLDVARNRWIGKEEILMKFGVEAARIVEVMGLMGDPVDNIPGVRGIGAKTAIALIQRFHSLENLFNCLDEVDRMRLRGAPRLRKILEADRANAFLSRSLATVSRDVPINMPLERLKFTGYDTIALRNLFVELEFTNLIPLLDHGRI